MKKSAKKEKELKVEIKEVKEEVKVEAVEEVAAEVKEEVKVEKKAKKEKKEKVKKEKINLPNLLTVVRICLVPVFVLLLVLEDLWVGLRYIALAIFVLASLTDWVDGKIARKKNIVTRFGKLMDPLADKILVASGFIMLTGLGVVPAWVTVLVVCRDFLLNTIRMFGTEAGVTISAGVYGKIKTAFQMVTITLGLLDTNGLFKFMSTQGRLMGFGELLLNVGFSISLVGAVIFTVWSTIDYVRKCGKYIDIRK